MLSEWYWKYPTQRKVLQKDLDELAKRIYFSPQPYFSEPYEVQSGDQLARIAKQYHVSWQYLAKLNQVQPKKLRVGRKLKVFEGPFQACVDLSDFELTIHQNGLFIKKYKVGIGKENSSPIGEFAVREKLENPTYYGPDGDVKEANDPLNPLGERWIDIGNATRSENLQDAAYTQTNGDVRIVSCSSFAKSLTLKNSSLCLEFNRSIILIAYFDVREIMISVINFNVV